MFLRKTVKWGSVCLLFFLLAWYNRRFFGEMQEDMLACTWNRTFHRLDGACFYWIMLRLTAWVMVYLRLLRLEGGFSIYLFLRQRSYGKIFVHIYAECIGIVLCCYGMETLTMAVCYDAAFPGVGVGRLLWQEGLPGILAEEGLEALSFCLAAYAVHCVLGHAEAGFLAVLAGRLLFNFTSGGGRMALPLQIVINLMMICGVFFLAFRNFAEKYMDR